MTTLVTMVLGKFLGKRRRMSLNSSNHHSTRILFSGKYCNPFHLIINTPHLRLWRNNAFQTIWKISRGISIIRQQGLVRFKEPTISLPRGSRAVRQALMLLVHSKMFVNNPGRLGIWWYLCTKMSSSPHLWISKNCNKTLKLLQPLKFSFKSSLRRQQFPFSIESM